MQIDLEPLRLNVWGEIAVHCNLELVQHQWRRQRSLVSAADMDGQVTARRECCLGLGKRLALCEAKDAAIFESTIWQIVKSW